MAGTFFARVSLPVFRGFLASGKARWTYLIVQVLAPDGKTAKAGSAVNTTVVMDAGPDDGPATIVEKIEHSLAEIYGRPMRVQWQVQ